MSQKLFLTVVTTTIFASVFNLPAQAEWEYTRWGMSVDEVVKASEGKAVPVNVSERVLLKNDAHQTLLKTQWSTEEYSFDVFFKFDLKDSKLSELLFKSTGNNEDLGIAMIEEFGLPSRAQGGLSKRDSDIRGFRLLPDQGNFATPEENVWRNEPERSQEDIAILLEWNTKTDFIQMSRQGEDDVVIRVRPAKSK